jgi:hypothetical protein
VGSRFVGWMLRPTRRNQPNYPQQNDRSDEGGKQADYEASADHTEDHGEEPAAQERADNPHDQISEQAVPMTAHHSPGQRPRDQPDQDEQDEVHGSLPLRMFTPTRYSITWSARSRSAGGIVTPSAFAVRMLMTSSEADGPTLTPSRCGGGPKAIAEFTVESVRVGYRLSPRNDGVLATISFLVPEGRTVRLLETRVTIQPSGDEGELRFIRQGWQALAWGPFHRTVIFTGRQVLGLRRFGVR